MAGRERREWCPARAKRHPMGTAWNGVGTAESSDRSVPNRGTRSGCSTDWYGDPTDHASSVSSERAAVLLDGDYCRTYLETLARLDRRGSRQSAEGGGVENMVNEAHLSTGIPGLDRLLRGLIAGDNLVWQVDRLEDFAPFVPPLCRHAIAHGKTIVYFRFADHPPLVPEDLPVKVCHLRTSGGLEQFITEIHKVLDEAGRGGLFRLRLPVDAGRSLVQRPDAGQLLPAHLPLRLRPGVAGLFPAAAQRALAFTPSIRSPRRRRSFSTSTGTAASCTSTRSRCSSATRPRCTCCTPGRATTSVPVTESSTTAEILTAMPWTGSGFRAAAAGHVEPHSAAGRGASGRTCSGGGGRPRMPAIVSHGLLRMVVSRDERVLDLVRRYFTLGDVLQIWKRMIGTGLIGGKSVGMLLARGILRATRSALERAAGSARFVLHRLRRVLLLPGGKRLLVAAAEAARPRDFSGRRRGSPPPDPHRHVPRAASSKEFSEMLDYFGQSPIIVRSSSLLEDNYGNAFAGKYESVFCANQGPHQKRLEDFLSGRPHDLRQHDEREGPALPGAARAAGPRRADVAAGAAGLRRPLRHLVLPAGGRRGLLVQSLRLEPVHRPARPAWCGWCSAWARGPWTARTTTTRGSWP